MSHTAAIRTQIQALEAEVRRDPRMVAIEHLKAALSILEDAGAAPTGGSSMPGVEDAPARTVPQQSAPAARPDSKIKRTHDVVGRYIDEHGPTHRGVLVAMLVESGLMEGVKNPITAFSTSMHTLRDHFVSDGHGTFRRREGAPNEVVPVWTKKREGPGLPTSSAQAETGGVAPPVPSQLNQNDERAAEIGAEAGGT